MSACALQVDGLRALRLRAAHFLAALLWLAIAHANHMPSRRAAYVMVLAAMLDTLGVRF